MANPHPLRPTETRKGIKNKVSSDLKTLIQGALDDADGPTYLLKLAQEQPGYLWFKLLSMLVLREISHSGVITGVNVPGRSNMALGPGRAYKQIQTQMEDEIIPQQLPVKQPMTLLIRRLLISKGA